MTPYPNGLAQLLMFVAGTLGAMGAARSGKHVAELLPVSDRHGLSLTPDAELAEDVRDVSPNRLPADKESFRDLLLA